MTWLPYRAPNLHEVAAPLLRTTHHNWEALYACHAYYPTSDRADRLQPRNSNAKQLDVTPLPPAKQLDRSRTLHAPGDTPEHLNANTRWQHLQASPYQSTSQTPSSLTSHHYSRQAAWQKQISACPGRESRAFKCHHSMTTPANITLPIDKSNAKQLDVTPLLLPSSLTKADLCMSRAISQNI